MPAARAPRPGLNWLKPATYILATSAGILVDWQGLAKFVVGSILGGLGYAWTGFIAGIASETLELLEGGYNWAAAFVEAALGWAPQTLQFATAEARSSLVGYGVFSALIAFIVALAIAAILYYGGEFVAGE